MFTMDGEWLIVLKDPSDAARTLSAGKSVLIDCFEFERDLGMESYEHIYKQLSNDLKRSIAICNGKRVKDPRVIFDNTFFPRLCTQSVFAPPLEWLIMSGCHMFERHPPRPFVINIARNLSVWKQFRAIRDDEETNVCILISKVGTIVRIQMLYDT